MTALRNFTTPSQIEVVNFLESGDAFETRAKPRRIDTHSASVFLCGDRAWKLKRDVRFGYLDFSTATLRHAALEAELRLNRRTAPELYLAVHPITRTSDGHLAIGGAGTTVDWLLEMKRFSDDALFDQLAARGRLDEQMLIRLAGRIAGFHAAAEPFLTDTGATRFRSVVEGNGSSLAAVAQILDPQPARRLNNRLHDLVVELAPLLDTRSLAGRIRHVHGDLHLANIALIDDLPTLFDCLEFSTKLATIDVLYDLAYLLMDLWQRDLPTAANVVFNRYLDLSPADEDATALMPLFLAVRATIRAHGLAAQAVRAERDRAIAVNARSYLSLAQALIEPAEPRLIAIGGLSGTGKSSLAPAVAGHIGRAPGARILRTDVLRKRLAGLSPETKLEPSKYTAQAAVQLYAHTATMTAAALAGGQSVIVDGVFAHEDQRLSIKTIAVEAGVRFDGLWMESSDASQMARIGSRGADASDADMVVAQAQSDLTVGDLQGWRRLSSTGPLATIAAAARRALSAAGS